MILYLVAIRQLEVGPRIRTHDITGADAIFGDHEPHVAKPGCLGGGERAHGI